MCRTQPCASARSEKLWSRLPKRVQLVKFPNECYNRVYRWCVSRCRTSAPTKSAYGEIAMSNEVFVENGPLKGKSISLKDILALSLDGGFYMRSELQVAIIEKQKVPWFTWVGAEYREVMLVIGDSVEGEGVTVDSARLDRQGHMHLRLRKHAIEPERYEFWKEAVKLRTPASVIFQCIRYEGRADLVGRNDVEGYMFLHFEGTHTTALATS